MSAKRNKPGTTPPLGWASYYDKRGALGEITEQDLDISLVEGLRRSIQSGARRYRLQSVTLKLDPIQVRAIKKLATMRAMPYQTLIRHWLAEDLKSELSLVAK